MAGVDRADLARRIHRSAHLRGEFLLRSGQTSTHYFDKYLFESDPELLRLIAQSLLPLVPAGSEGVAGLELGGVPIATVLSQLTGMPAFFVRKKAKPYGTRRLAEGGDVSGRRLAVVEDVVTSGGQVLKSCRDLAERGAQVTGVLCVIDREAGGEENLREAGLQLRSLFRMSELEEAAAG